MRLELVQRSGNGQTRRACALGSQCVSRFRLDPRCAILTSFDVAVELWTYTRKIRWEHWLCRRWTAATVAGQSSASTPDADRKPAIVDVRSPRTWTPWGLFMDWLALRIRRRMVRLMCEGTDAREEDRAERTDSDEPEKPPLFTAETVEEYLA